MNIDTYIDIVTPGAVAYQDALELQQKRKERLLAGTGIPAIIILEHEPPAITVGRHGNRDNIHVSPEKARELGIDIFTVSRGGDVTVHEKGQLVLYFIFPLPSKTGGIFADILLGSLQLFVRHIFNLEVTQKRGFPGLWYNQGKVAAIGLDVTGNVSMHGMSLNVSNSLEVFSLVRPCGMDRQITSISKILDKEIVMEVVQKDAADFYRNEGALYIKKALHDIS